MPEDKHPQLPVGCLIHGLGLHAHLVLLRGQFIHTALLMPKVEKSPHRCAYHYEVAVEILPVQVYIFTTPAFDVQVKSTCGNRTCYSIVWHILGLCGFFIKSMAGGGGGVGGGG